MSNLQSFSQSTIEALKYYVYALVDISTNKICYIGKGQNQRVFESLKDKNNKSNNSLQAYIIRHNLTENEALLLEASLIDFLPFFSLSDLNLNIVEGHNTNETGIISIEDIENKYASSIITENDFQHNVLIISVEKSVYLRKRLTEVGLYECTRKAWSVNLDKAKKVDFVIAKYNGVLKEIYKVNEWKVHQFDKSNPFYKETSKPKYEFIGDVVMDSNIRELYLNKKLDKRSYGQPLTYIINKELTNESE